MFILGGEYFIYMAGIQNTRWSEIREGVGILTGANYFPRIWTMDYPHSHDCESPQGPQALTDWLAL